MDLKDFIQLCAEQKDDKQCSMKELHDDAFKTWLDDYTKEHSIEQRVSTLKELGLNADDGFFIWAYTGSSSSWLNSDKRNCSEYNSDCKLLFANGLTRGLQKLRPFEGEVWRWEEADDELKKFNWFKNRIGSTLRVPYFLSTGKDDTTEEPMLWEITTISNGNARDISGISNNLYENEVLFLPNAKFIIIGVKDDNKTIIMNEISPDSEIEFDLCCEYSFEPKDIDPSMLEP